MSDEAITRAKRYLETVPPDQRAQMHAIRDGHRGNLFLNCSSDGGPTVSFYLRSDERFRVSWGGSPT